METFAQVLSELETALDEVNCVATNFSESRYKNQSVFKNPHKLPINQIHLERTVRVKIKDPPDNLDVDSLTTQDLAKYYETKKQVIPALHKSWTPQHMVYHRYVPYIMSLETGQNDGYVEENTKFISTLSYLIDCSYHEFWCIVLYEPQFPPFVSQFLLNPSLAYEMSEMPYECAEVYETVFTYMYCLYEKLVTFKKSDEEYMPQRLGLKYLLEKKLLNLPVIITLATVYIDVNPGFVNRLTDLYFSDDSQKAFQEKEVEELLNHTRLILEMIEMLICRQTECTDVIPIAIDQRPHTFSLEWVYSVVNYLLNTVVTLHRFFEVHKPAIGVAFNLDMPVTLCTTYENVYAEIYDMLDEREEVETCPELSKIILDQIGLGRAEFLTAYNCFVSYCLDKALANQDDPSLQNEYAERYLKLMDTALEHEYFICDFNVKFDVEITNEMFMTSCGLDSTRTDYISKCVKNLPRTHKLTSVIKQRRTVESTFRDHTTNVVPERAPAEATPVPGTSNGISGGRGDNDIDEKIAGIIDMFPHLGDGFVLKCLEAYNYQPSEVINAILEENLPPHLASLPFDEIRIPDEPPPPEPILAYTGKRPDIPDDFRVLLDDRKAKDEMKTYILEGVQYGTSYDPYDDEYDDREDDPPLPVFEPQSGGDVITRFNPNYRPEEESDSSENSESEQDSRNRAGNSNPKGRRGPKGRKGNNDEEIKKKGRAEGHGNHGKGNGVEEEGDAERKGGDERGRRDFCEDPSVLRARREARYGNTSKRDCTDKPKDNDKEKKEMKINRLKKGVNKSASANHNRKTGAQWKRSRGMMPF